MSEVPIMVMPWHRPDPCKTLKHQTEAAFKASYIDYMASLNLESLTLPVPLTAIMCTMGPASNSMDMMVELMHQGMTMALVPLSIGTREDHIQTIAVLREANKAFSQLSNRVFPLAICVQTKGPGLRIGGLKKDLPVNLPLNHKITLTTDKTWRTKGTEHYLYIGFPEVCEVLSQGDVLLIGNGVVILQVEHVANNEVDCKVAGGGVIQSFMPISVPDVPLRLPPLTDEDIDDLRLAVTLGVDVVVATRTQTASHIQEVRRVLAEDERGGGVQVWAQIESKQALENLEEILEEADAVLMSRLSLTQDMNPDKLFIAQKILLSTCNKMGVPVFVSSHFLPSMQVDVTPSVAELTDVASAILDGADGFVLRNTTAFGKSPDLTVKTLSHVCLEAESAVWHFQTFNYLNLHAAPPIDPTHAVAISAVEAALKCSAAAILMATTSGRSARLVSRYRPRCPIIAVTRYGQVARQLNAWRAVIPLHYVDPPLPDWTREVDVRLQYGMEYAKQVGIVVPGDVLVLLNGWRLGAGFTNTVRVVYASDSFPWVYPHQVPSVVPSDKNVVEGAADSVGNQQVSAHSSAERRPKGKAYEDTVDTISVQPSATGSAPIKALLSSSTMLKIKSPSFRSAVESRDVIKPSGSKATASEELRKELTTEVMSLTSVKTRGSVDKQLPQGQTASGMDVVKQKVESKQPSFDATSVHSTKD